MAASRPNGAGRTHPSVIFINRFFYPDESATSQLLSDLAFDLAQDFQVTIVASRLRHDQPDARLPAREMIRGVGVRRVPSTRFGRGGLLGRAMDLASFYVFAGLMVAGLARRGDIIVAKTDPPLLSILAAIVARLKGAVLVNWLQDLYPEVASRLGVRGLDGWLGRRLLAWRDASLRAARANVVLGARMAEHIGRGGAPQGRIAVIPNWSDELTITPIDANSNPLRREWGLESRFVVLYSGNLGRAHDFETMLGAAQNLADDPRIVFLMIGSGHRMAELKAAVRELGVGNVVFKPFQDQAGLAHSLGVGDVHWLSLRPDLEGLIVPSKAYGVLAAGRPIIAVTDPDGEIARLVRDHGCGDHVELGDSAAFAALVRQWADDAEYVRTLSAAARRAATGEFSRKKALARWRAVLADDNDRLGTERN